LRGAVVEGFGRDGRAVCEVNGDAMSLVGADFAAACVIGEALFRVGGDDVVEQGAVECGAVGIHLADEGGDVRPAVRVEGDADAFGVVAQDEAQVFADAGAGIGVFHGDGRGLVMSFGMRAMVGVLTLLCRVGFVVVDHE